MDTKASTDGEPTRCGWVGNEDLYLSYHDDEWGRPSVDDGDLFEKMCLEAFQSGLSWITVLRKRESFREAFDGFNVEVVSAYDQTKIDELLDNADIIRNRAKILASINNAQAMQALWADGRTLAGVIWSHEPGRDSTNPVDPVPASTDESKALAKELKTLGFKFVGPTTAYAAMQAMGVVNDHDSDCHVRGICEDERSQTTRPTA